MWDGIIQVVEINCNFYIYEINLYELGIVIIIILNNAIKRKGDCEKSGKIENNLVFADIYFYPLLATNVESLFPRDPTIVLSTISRTCSASKVYYLNFCKPRFVPLRWFFKIGSDGGPMNLNATIYIYQKGFTWMQTNSRRIDVNVYTNIRLSSFTLKRFDLNNREIISLSSFYCMNFYKK